MIHIERDKSFLKLRNQQQKITYAVSNRSYQEGWRWMLLIAGSAFISIGIFRIMLSLRLMKLHKLTAL